MGALMGIGALAKRSGVSVQTIRFYSDQGLLPPSHVAESGYRKYSEDDRAKLLTIRALRGFGVDLEHIRALLDGEQTGHDVLRLRQAALDVELRQLQRQKSALDAALAQDRDPLATLARLEALTKLDALEKERLLAHRMRAGLEDVVDPDWLDRILHALLSEFPDTLDDGQWEALLELTEIVTDAGFVEQLAERARPFWAGLERFDLPSWQDAQRALMDDALGLAQKGVAPDDDAARALATRVSRLFAEASGGTYDAARDDAALLAHVDAHDPRAERVWALAATVRGQPESPVSRAYAYLWQALRAKVSGPGTAAKTA